MTGYVANEKRKGQETEMNHVALTFLFSGTLLAFLLTLSWIDAKTYRLPDKYTLPLIPLGFLQSYLLLDDWKISIIGAVAGYIVFVAIEYIFKILRGKDGLGRGDAKLLAAGGAWCGWIGLPLIVLIASGTGLVAALLPSFRNSAEQGRIAFGPFLAFGIFMVWAANAYVGLSG